MLLEALSVPNSHGYIVHLIAFRSVRSPFSLNTLWCLLPRFAVSTGIAFKQHPAGPNRRHQPFCVRDIPRSQIKASRRYRSKGLSTVVKVLSDDAQRPKLPNSLGHTVQFAREALKELPRGREHIPNIADTFIFHAQTKAISPWGVI
ncbi:hypothetical protein F4861DRAFT_501272 [Xylaria intraflava]|nr:hypothetical protein F4861DRAFT_501272 [Xylaria intraflava]